MKITTFYQADDGTQFDTQLECVSYERKHELSLHIVKHCDQSVHGEYVEDILFGAKSVNDYIHEYFDEIAAIVDRTKT